MEYKRYFYTNYYAAKNGTVKNNKGVILKPFLHNDYHCLGLMIDGKYKKVKLHRIIMLCFEPRIDYIYLQVNHKDGNKLNNHIDNLEWCTAKENMIHYHTILKNK